MKYNQAEHSSHWNALRDRKGGQEAGLASHASISRGY